MVQDGNSCAPKSSSNEFIKDEDSDIPKSSTDQSDNNEDSDVPKSSSNHSDTTIEDLSCDESSSYDDYEIDILKYHHDSDIDQDDHIVHGGSEDADVMCQKLNELIRTGVVRRDDILYKYLNDVVESRFNQFHRYSDEVINFFKTLEYLGGHSTVNMIRGPMFAGQGRKALHNINDCRMNLGGPSTKTSRIRHPSGYTVESGVIKPLLETYQTIVFGKTDRVFLVHNDKVQIIPVALANDGNPLKPGIRYDVRLKRNVGLDTKCDENFIKNNPNPPEPEWLKSHFVTEVLVSCLTTLDDHDSLPIATDYVSKCGKSTSEMKGYFLERIKVLQVCKRCVEQMKSEEHILSDISMCQSLCEECINNKSVCQLCSSLGQTSHIPALRACSKCINDGVLCSKLAVLVLVVDCESGNKGAMLELKDDIISGEIESEAAMLSLFPDPPHLGKSLKASYANWFLIFIDVNGKSERGNLSILYTLRNCSDEETMQKMRTLLTKNDYVKNKDRQDPIAVLQLTRTPLIAFLDKIGSVVHTIIPETIRYTEDNKVGMYESPVSVSTYTHGKILFLTHNTADGSSKLYSARLHNPVDQVTLIKQNNATFVTYAQGIVFLVGCNSEISFIDSEKSVHISPTNIKQKAKMTEILLSLGQLTTGTLSTMRDRLVNHLKSVSDQYEQLKYPQDSIIFWNLVQQPAFESIHCIDKYLIYAACSNERYICSIILTYDGVGIGGALTVLHKYDESWTHISGICVSSSFLYILHNKGITRFCMVNHTIYNFSISCHHAAPYHEGLIFTSPKNHCISYIKNNCNNINNLVGCGDEGHRDGVSSKVTMYQPFGIATERDSIIYFTDVRANTVRMCTSLKLTAKFFQNIGKIFDAFSIHAKGDDKHAASLDTAINLVASSNAYFQEQRQILSDVLNTTKTLNGPEGSISSPSMQSIKLLEWSLRNLQKHTTTFAEINLESSTTLDTEHFHSTVHRKEQSLTPLQYAQTFGKTLSETVKKQTKGSFHYFTSTESWYPVLHDTRTHGEVKMMSALPIGTISSEAELKLKDFASAFGRPVRQKTNRQTTTMANAGTLPDYCYKKTVIPSMEVNLYAGPSDVQTFSENEAPSMQSTSEDNRDSNSDQEEEDEFPHFDSDSPSSESDIELDSVEIDSSSLFLVGRESRVGRKVKINKKYFS